MPLADHANRGMLWSLWPTGDNTMAASPPDDDVFVTCPHCGGGAVVAVKHINCAIFRHGAFQPPAGRQREAEPKPLPPHATQAQCEAWLAAGIVMGCARPFQLVKGADGAWSSQACAYI